MQVLGGVAHVQGGGVHQPFGHETGVRVGAGAHGVVAHVLHAAGDDDVVRAETDAAGRGRHGGHGAGTHAVHGEARDGAGQSGQQRGGPAQGEALVAGLGGGGDGHLIHPLRRQRGVPAQQLADALYDQVVGAGTGMDPLLTGPAEGRAEAVNKDDVADSAPGGAASGVAHV